MRPEIGLDLNWSGFIDDGEAVVGAGDDDEWISSGVGQVAAATGWKTYRSLVVV